MSYFGSYPAVCLKLEKNFSNSAFLILEAFWNLAKIEQFSNITIFKSTVLSARKSLVLNDALFYRFWVDLMSSLSHLIVGAIRNGRL